MLPDFSQLFRNNQRRTQRIYQLDLYQIDVLHNDESELNPLLQHYLTYI
jgi:hypothetical protein